LLSCWKKPLLLINRPVHECEREHRAGHEEDHPNEAEHRLLLLKGIM
jgi:hypothetical protein